MSTWTPIIITAAAVAAIVVVHRLAEPTVRGFGVSMTALYLGLAAVLASWVWWGGSRLLAWLGLLWGST